MGRAVHEMVRAGAVHRVVAGIDPGHVQKVGRLADRGEPDMRVDGSLGIVTHLSFVETTVCHHLA